MGRAHGGRENQLTLLVTDPHTIIREAWEQHGENIIRRTGMLSGGNDSATLVHWLAWHGYIDELLFLNTGTGIRQTREFVRRFADYLGLPLQEWHVPPGTYKTMIGSVSGGFPGPAAHSYAYQRLKERPLANYLAYWVGWSFSLCSPSATSAFNSAAGNGQA
jgi:3'-phosphoadenosine 5'-phosphosulfate sulfotransferase (PAPS reductase)/FAD synthetase